LGEFGDAPVPLWIRMLRLERFLMMSFSHADILGLSSPCCALQPTSIPEERIQRLRLHSWRLNQRPLGAYPAAQAPFMALEPTSLGSVSGGSGSIHGCLNQHLDVILTIRRTHIEGRGGAFYVSSRLRLHLWGSN
jgi:hypothetical protein